MTPREECVMRRVKASIGRPNGKCYPASEAVYHLLGGKKAGYTPIRGDHHWWVRSPSGEVLDPTAAQYDHQFDYSVGRGGGFLTKLPSKRGQQILTKIHFATKGIGCYDER